MSGKYEQRRAQLRAHAQDEPFCCSAGLAHVIATVREPRNDDGHDNPAFNEFLKRHRGQLISDVNEVLRGPHGTVPVSDLGGAIEDVIDRAATRLRAAAVEHEALDVIDRLDRLTVERRLGVDAHVAGPDYYVAIEFDEILRSRVSGRRVGLWR